MSEPGYTATSESSIVDAFWRVVAALDDEVALPAADGGPSRARSRRAERVAAIARPPGTLGFGPGGTAALPVVLEDGEDGGGSSKPPAEVGDGEDGGGSSSPPAGEPGKTGDGEDGGGSSAPPAGEPAKTSDGEDGGGSSAPPEDAATVSPADRGEPGLDLG